MTVCYDEITEEEGMGESSSSHLWIFTCFVWVPKSCNYITVGMVNVG